MINHAIVEMEKLKNNNCESWLTRVCKIEKVLKIPQNISYNKMSGKKILAILKSRFDSNFLMKINEVKQTNLDSIDHNKLRTYRTLKSSFTREPYIDLVRNRNQRCFISRLHVGSHNLRVELGRHTRPITPFAQRTCQYCCQTRPGPCPQPRTPVTSTPAPAPPDTEFHFLMDCPLSHYDRNCLFERFETINCHFPSLTPEQKFKVLLCPVDTVAIKLVNRFIKYQPSGEGGARSPPATPHRLQNPKWLSGDPKMADGVRKGVYP